MADYYDLKAVEDFIRKEAAKRGIDPEIALKVARSEGLAPGVWQSNVVGPGGREKSYGPFQLYDEGLGAKFEKQTGKESSDPSSVFDQITFALDEARAGGWGPWHGWKGDAWAGIRGGGGPRRHVGGAGSSPASFTPETTPTDSAAPEAEPVVADATPKAEPGILDSLLGKALGKEEGEKPLEGLIGQMMKGPPQMSPPPDLLPRGGGSSAVQSLPEYIQQFMAMRMRGLPSGAGGPSQGGGSGLG